MQWRGMRVGALMLFLCSTNQPVWASPASWVESFQNELAALAERSHQNQDPQQGLAEARRLLQRLLHEVAGGQQACVLFARVELLRAIFEAKLQRWEDAAWDYAVALNLDPEVARFSFSEYPDLAAIFLAERDRWRSAFEQRRKRQGERKEPPKLSTACAAPKRLTDKSPVYPKGARKDRRETSVHLEVVIGKDGAPLDPLWESNCDLAPFFVAAAEAVRFWRWEPLPCEGADGPEELLNSITVNFALHP